MNGYQIAVVAVDAAYLLWFLPKAISPKWSVAPLFYVAFGLLVAATLFVFAGEGA